MSKNGKAVTKHIVGVGDVTSYDDVPDAREESMRRERPDVAAVTAGAQKNMVGGDYHMRPASQEEIAGATAKALASKMGQVPAQGVDPKIAESIIATLTAKHVSEGGAHKHVGPADMPVTGEAEDAPPAADLGARAKVVAEENNDDEEEEEVKKVEPVDERYGLSAKVPGPKSAKLKSIGVGDRVYVPGVKGLGIVQSIAKSSLIVEMENDSIVTVDFSEVTPLGPAEKGWYGSMKGKKKKKSEPEDVKKRAD